MKFARITCAFASMASMASMALAHTPVSDTIEVIPPQYSRLHGLVEQVIQTQTGIEKRNDQVVSALTEVFTEVYESGIVVDVVNDIGSSQDKMEQLSKVLVGLLNSTLNGNSSQASAGVNTSNIIDVVFDNGIVYDTLNEAMLNETNRHEISVLVGKLLCTQPYVAKILSDLGYGQKLTWDYLNDVIRNTKAKAPDTVSQTLKSMVLWTIQKRDNGNNQYAGSAAAFLNNLISTVASSSLVTSSLNDTLTALDDSNILVPLGLQLAQNDNTYNIVKYVSAYVYNSSVLDAIDLNAKYQKARKDNILSDSVQKLLTSETYSPPLALILKYSEDNGVYAQVQRNLFGHN